MTKTVDLGVEGLSPAVYVGAGGSANVLAARILETGQEVAVKLLRASADSDKERERFEREHETLSRLSTHDGIVPVIDAGVTDRNEPYFLMPLMEGSLQDRIDNEGALEWETASQLIAEISDTLDFAHSNSVLHRDLKPGNILLDTDGVPRIADFGIAKLLDSNVSKSSKALGTPSFMPPERFKAVEATEASDVYGLGATLAALLTGTAPFLTGENDTDAAVMMRVMNEEPAPLTDSGVPEPIAAIVTQSMSKDPESRPASAGEFAALLRTASAEAGGAVSSGPVTVAIPRRELTIPELSTLTVEPAEDEDEKRPAWILMAAAAVFIALLGVGGALAWSQRGDSPFDDADAVETAAVLGAIETADGVDAAGGVGGESEAEGSQTASESGDSTGGASSTADGDRSNGENSNADGTTGGADAAESNGTDNADGASKSTGGSDGDGATGETGGSNGGDEGSTDQGTVDPTPEPTVAPTTAAPVAAAKSCFSVSKSSVEVGSSVSFTNCSTDATSYSWSFGDGTTSSKTSPSKSWSTPGSKTVRLTATGPGGTSQWTKTITVSEQPPAPVAATACLKASTKTVQVGVAVSFSNCSTDATSYSWSFGDGTTSPLTSPSKSWTTTGSKTVRLTATGPGGSDSATTTITVNPVPVAAPVASFTASATTIEEGGEIKFTSTSTGEITSLRWDFGDGGSSTQSPAWRTYSTAGTYTVKLTVTGPGGSHTASRTITVNKKTVTAPEFSQRIDIGDIGETNVRFRFMTNITTGYTIYIQKGGSTVTTQSGTATGGTLVNANVGGLTKATEYTILVRLAGPPSVDSGSVLFKTAGTTTVTTVPTAVSLQNLRLVTNGSTRFEFHYESNICANGSFVIREGGTVVGSNAGQADGCTNRHLGIPGFWTPALKPNTTYVVTVTVEANGQGQGGGNTASKTLTVTTTG